MTSRRWIRKWAHDVETDGFSPIPTQVVSNEEFIPRPQNEQQKQVETMIGVLAEEKSKKLGLDRRTFMASSMGLATAFLASNMVYGKHWDVDEIETAVRKGEDRDKVLLELTERCDVEFGRDSGAQGAKLKRSLEGIERERRQARHSDINAPEQRAQVGKAKRPSPF